MKKISICLIFAIILMCYGQADLFAGEKGNFSTKPLSNNGKKWRIGYLEGGRYRDYEVVFKAIIEGLTNLGWMERINIKESDFSTHQELWNYVSANSKSKYLEFVSDAFYTSNFDKNLRSKTKSAVLTRLNKVKDIDMMIAMGTWAGQDLANNEHSIPTIVASTSDPLKAGIIKSVEDSGYDHIHAKVNPTRFANHIKLFHQIVGFKKLGIVYENSVEGRSFAAVEDAERLSKELGYELVRCFAPFSNVTQEEAENAVVDCYKKIAPIVDAVYITVHRGNTLKRLPDILAPLNKYKVYSYSMSGSQEVNHGVLMSIAMAGFKYSGQFYAETMAKAFNGAKLRDLNQILVDPPKIAINLKTAAQINYEPDYDVLAAADEIYQEIEVAK